MKAILKPKPAIYEKYPQISYQIKENTAIAYTNKVKVEFYGHIYKRDGGTRGISKYIRVREGDIPLTEQENNVLKKHMAFFPKSLLILKKIIETVV